MKKYLFIILLVGVWNCEDERKEDTTPPSVTITSPQNNSEVSELVSITCMASDNEGVDRVELWVNGSSTGLIDQTEPYSFEWNSSTYSNGDYTIIIRGFDVNGNTTDSEPLVINIINSIQAISISSITYDTEKMVINWGVSNIDYFLNYQVYESQYQSGSKNLIATYTDQSVVSHSIADFNPNEQKWFWVSVSDTLGRNQLSEGIANELNSEPSIPFFERIYYDDGFQFRWSKNDEFDFQKYVIHSLNDQGQQTSIVYETTNVNDTVYVMNNVTENGMYHVGVIDHWGLVSNSEPEQLVVYVELWHGEIYSVENTTSGSQINWGEGSILPEIGYLTNLIDINIQGDFLTGSIPLEIGYLKNLQELAITNSSIGGSIPPQLGNLTNLVSLNLGNNQLTGSIPPEIGNLIKLTNLNIRNNQLTGSIPSELGNLTELERIYLHQNELSGQIPSTIGNLIKLYNLNFRDNNLSGPIPSEIGDLLNLTGLFLGDNPINDLIPIEIINLTNLTNLQMPNCGLIGSIPNEISNMVSLQLLILNNNHLTGTIPDNVFINNSDVYTLDLSHNQLTGEIPSGITTAIGLDYLLLNNNYLTGPIPTDIGNLNDLESLKLDYNQISGVIPSSIGNLTSLRNLYLNNNDLSGSIPSQIGNLTLLSELDLAHNQLSGVIPDELCNLNINSIPVYNNNLCPPYPACITNGDQDTSGCD
jgi:Leucine-rich repeat (LRR) protein